MTMKLKLFPGHRGVAFHRRRSPGMASRSHPTRFFFGHASEAHFRRSLAVVLIVASAVLFSVFLLYKAADSAGLQFPPVFDLSSQLHFGFPYSAVNYSADDDEFKLDRVLKKAAMDDGTVILTTLNEAWAAPNSIIDLFLESFRVGKGTHRLLEHLVIIALDEKAFSRCLAVHMHCFALPTEPGTNFSGEAYFMTHDYLKMMWRRIEFLRSVLEMGYNFLFTDADILWFRDPFPLFNIDADFQIACDHFLGNSNDLNNRPNGGFKFVRSNNRSIEFYKFWYSSQELYPGYHDQDVLNNIKYDDFVIDLGLNMRFLSTAYFGGLCEPSKDLNQVCTMHANCCFGLDNKLNDLKVMLEDWKHFLSLPPSLKKSSLSSWRVPQRFFMISGE
ncbi:uncharacterized protein At4g15970-like [Impatiens glandulifera]|uniref:uncharacterized protein At4g15970-like n=1 Tax=Impatiens glandulifera TaxID=253017 RepID=UPI001FB18406|nr:uncharacterized protein At4g15970-like [Impatiens glandulifera]